MPSASRYSTAAPKPIASVIAGVPASNFHGGSVGVKPSRGTSRIISPPPRKGGIPSRRSSRPHSAPIPVGPSILWAENATKSASQAWMSVGTWGTYWQGGARRGGPAGGGGGAGGGAAGPGVGLVGPPPLSTPPRGRRAATRRRGDDRGR